MSELPEMEETQLAFKNIQKIHSELMILITKKEDFREAISQLVNQLETSMNALTSFLNYFRTLQTIFSDLQQIFEWSSVSPETEIDELRQRLRLVLVPKSETLISNLLMADKSSKNLMPFLQTEFRNFPDLFKLMKYNSQTMLEILQYNPADNTSLLFHIFSFLWQGNVEKANENIQKALGNIEFIKSTRERESE